jgi:hypothetical protein
MDRLAYRRDVIHVASGVRPAPDRSARQGGNSQSATGDRTDYLDAGGHGRSRLSTKRMAIGFPAIAPAMPSVKFSGVQRSSAAAMALR